jgi:TonB family protein
VKTNRRTIVLAVSLGLAVPAIGTELVRVNGQVPPVLDATTALLRELQAAIDPKLPLRAAFERVEAFRPTPATADKLRSVFGTDRPYLFARQPDKGGRPAWRATLLPLHYQSVPGSGVDWDGAVADLTLDKGGNGLDIDGSWPRLSIADGSMRMTLSGMTLNGHQQRGYGGVWYGDGQFKAAGMRVGPANGDGAVFEASDLRTAMRTTEHPKTADVMYDARVGAINVVGERIEDAHVAVRIVNIDKQLLTDAKAASDKEQAQPASATPVTAPTPEQRLETMKPWLRAFGRSAIARGTVIEIDDISARFHGNKASIHGRIALAGARASELDDVKLLARRIVASFEIRVPLALVRDVGGIVAAKQAAAQQGNAAPQNLPPNAQMGQTIADVIVGKLVGGGIAKVENDTLVSNLEWRDGQLSANGKPLALPTIPTPGAPGAPAKAPLAFSETVSAGPGAPVPAEPLPQDALQARLVEASCRLPDYPDEVVRANAPLRLVLGFRVDTAGKVQGAAIAAPSRFPAWDAAALAALAQCTYIPALKDGQPFEVPMRWTIQREPGSARP